MRIWILERYQTYARICLMTALFLSPVIFYRTTVDVFNLVKITTLWLLGIVALAFFLIWSLERGVRMPSARLFVAGAVFLAACGAATVISDNPALSLLGLYHRYGGLIPFLLYSAIAVLIVGLYWERPGDLKEIARAFTAASMIMAAYILIQAAGLDWIEWRDASGARPEFPVGTMGNSNFAGGYLGIAAPYFLYVAASARSRMWQRVLSAFVGLDVLAVWYTQTRGGMIAAAVGLLAVAFMYRDRLARWAKVAIAGGVVALGLVAVMVLFHPGSDRAAQPLGGIQTFRTGTFQVRTYYWMAAWRIFADNPFLGTGLETYYANYPRYRLPADGAELGLAITDKPHNIFLEYAANAGAVGLASYLFLVGIAALIAYRRAHQVQGAQRLLLVTFLASLVGYLAQGFFSIDVPPLAMMGWVAMGGIATIADPKVIRARAKARAEEGNPRSGTSTEVRAEGTRSWVRKRVYQTAITVMAAILLVTGARPVYADWRAKHGEVADANELPPERIASFYEEAALIHPLEPSYRAQLGSLAERRAESSKDPGTKARFLDEAIDRYRQARRLQPGNIFYLINIARLHTIWAVDLDVNRFTEADLWWRRAVAYDSTDWEVRNSYALMLNSWANAAGGDPSLRKRTADELERVVRMRPSYVPAWINLGKVYRVLGDNDQAKRALEAALAREPENQEARSLLAAL